MSFFSRASRRCLIVFVILCVAGVSGASAAPEGTLTIGVGPRVDDIMASAIPGFCMSPYEDLKLKSK